MSILSLIVAVAENGVIGRDNRLPWHLPGDLKYFKAMTLGKPVLMGRKTWESLGRPLPGRPNVVITRDPAFQADGASVGHSLDEGLRLARDLAGPEGEVMVIGGADLFRACLDQADRLYLTEVHRAYDGDVFFPPLDRSRWVEASRQHHDGDPAYSLVVLQRP